MKKKIKIKRKLSKWEFCLPQRLQNSVAMENLNYLGDSTIWTFTTLHKDQMDFCSCLMTFCSFHLHSSLSRQKCHFLLGQKNGWTDNWKDKARKSCDSRQKVRKCVIPLKIIEITNHPSPSTRSEGCYLGIVKSHRHTTAFLRRKDPC